jgi:hypothetical protein
MEKRKQYFGSHMAKSGGTAAAISLTAVIMVFSVAVLVPEPSLGGEQGERRRPAPELVMDRLSSILELSSEQQTAMAPVMSAEVERRRALMDQFRAEERERRQQLRLEMTEIDEDTAEQLAAILSPDQLDKFNELQDLRRIRGATRQIAWNGRHPRGYQSGGFPAQRAN